MKSETYKYQRYMSAIFIIKLFELLIVILLFCNVFFFNFLIKTSVFLNSFFLLILISWYGIDSYKKYSLRFNTLVTFDTDKISAVNGPKIETIKVDKNLEIWVLSSKSNRYQQYTPYQQLKNNTLIIIGNAENFKDKKIKQIANTVAYDNNLQHLEAPFDHGYISIIYREPLKEWLNLYNKQIYRDRFPVENYNRLQHKIQPSFVTMHHF